MKIDLLYSLYNIIMNII